MKSRKLTAFLAAFFLLILTACGDTPDELTISDLREPDTDIQPVNMTYTAKQLPVTMDSSQEDVCVFGNYILWEEMDMSSYYEVFDLSANAMTESPFPEFDGITKRFQPYSLQVQGDTLHAYFMESEFDADGDWTGGRYVQLQLDEQLNPIEEITLFDYDQEIPEIFYSPYVQNPDGSYLAASFDGNAETIHRLDADLQVMGRVDAPPLYLENLFPMEDGRVYVSYSGGMGDTGVEIGILSAETMTLETAQIEGLPMGLIDVFAGNGEYELFVMNHDGMYGIRDGVCTEVVNFLKINFNGNRAEHGAALPDGRFLLGIWNDDSTETEYWLLTETEVPETEPEVIRFATLYGGYEDEVNAFNRAHADCRIELVNYSEYIVDGDPDAAVAQYQRDMLAGDVADIVENNGLPFTSYIRKGLYEDLNPWLEQDESFDPDDYFMNYFDALETDGKLYQINFGFSVETFAAKTEFVGDAQPPLTFAEFWKLTQNLPEGMDIFYGMNDHTMLNTLCTPNLHCFVDYEAAACYFDTPEFIDLLERCTDYISFDEQMAQDAAKTNDEWQVYEDERQHAYRNNTALLMPVQIYGDPYEWHKVIAGDFGSAEVTMIGTPSNDKTSSGGTFSSYGSLAMSSVSEYKEIVWEFFRSLLSENYQNHVNELPVLRSAMEKRMEAAMQPTVPAGEEVFDIHRSWAVEDGMIPIGNATQEEMDAFLAYVEGVTEINNTDPNIYNIFWEEAEMFLAGDQSAENAAKMMQSRVSIYLSEQS